MQAILTETVAVPVRPAALIVAERDMSEQRDALARAQALAEPLLCDQVLDTGENMLDHARAVASILAGIGGSQAMQAAAYLVYAGEHLQKPKEVIARAFDDNFAELAVQTTKLVALQRQARKRFASAAKTKRKEGQSDLMAAQTENVRKMLLAFSKDVRVVMLRLASRLQTLRYFAQSKTVSDLNLAAEALQVFAPLANRLGIWQIKWEMEDLAFRFLEPETYREVARLLDEKRAEREAYMAQLRTSLQAELRAMGMAAEVSGRPKHIYSIVKKMRGKSLAFSRVFDVRALRVIVPDVNACYAALALVHERFTPVLAEFDDYIAKPKPNGYQSLHTVVQDTDGRAVEIQIRTQAMHDHAESGVAAHWAYKEAGTKGYAGVSAASDYDAKIAVLRQLLAWQADVAGTTTDVFDDMVYVLTPQAAIVELPAGSTPLDFAYSVHTELGHRCRGAKVDGQLVSLSTPLRNGQTVEVVVAKEGGPSRDWLDADNTFLVTHRARTKVRAWFNAQAAQAHVSKGRDLVEKLLQREGKTALKLDDLAQALGFDDAQALFEVVGKDELSLKAIENQWRAPEPGADADLPSWMEERTAQHPPAPKGGVLVVGVDSLLTQLAKCCRPAPPDAIEGFVTRGRGVSIHRCDCKDLANLKRTHADRVIDVAWTAPDASGEAMYPVDIQVQAMDRQGLLRDISDVLAREKTNVIGVHTASVKDQAHMTFTVQVPAAGRLNKVLASILEVTGVKTARRR
jgi:GTP pyrophosphokinase